MLILLKSAISWGERRVKNYFACRLQQRFGWAFPDLNICQSLDNVTAKKSV